MAPSRQNPPNGRSSVASSNPITDPRFANIYTDPRFRLPSKKVTHVSLDKRFARMLQDDDFSKKASVDRYGRKLPKGIGKKELERFYRMEDRDDEMEDKDSEAAPHDDFDNDDKVLRELARVDQGYDPARNGGFSSSSGDSSSDEEDSDGLVSEEESYHFPGSSITEAIQVPMGEVSSRLAVVNLDWDNIRATDLMAVFSSFCPPSGRIKRVAIYPSRFGRERMDREEMEGPPREIFSSSAANRREGSLLENGEDDDEDEEEDDEKIKESLLQEQQAEEFDSSSLRRYQLERLRYYYAVLTLSSAETAKSIYDATDGAEYLTTANFFDLRFVPDDVSFDDDTPRDECSAIPDGYKPSTFVTDALQHSKVKLTWDAEDNVRKEVAKKAFSGSRADIEENDLKAYLGSDSSDEDGDDGVDEAAAAQIQGEARLSKKEEERRRLRAALGLDQQPASSRSKSQPTGDMEITFSSGLSKANKKGSVFENKPPEDETTMEKYVRKEKERRQKRKEKAKAGRAVESEEDAETTRAGGPDQGDEGSAADLGFDDPFFTSAANGEPDHKDRKAKSTSDRKKGKSHREGQDGDAEAASRQRAELELLMLDDNANHAGQGEAPADSGAPSKLSHFDINEIARAEKAARRKKKKRVSKRQADEVAGGSTDQQEGFNMDVRDPRFAALYRSHEFAIDPTNPRFRDTQGMRALLEEGRKKRKGAGGGELAEEAEAVTGNGETSPGGKSRKKKRKMDDGVVGGDGDAGDSRDLQRLVERVKVKAKRS